jgi:ubiquinone/menaquinone biosynthesis C-methylase UbiE
LPSAPGLWVLDVAAGGGDIDEAIMRRRGGRVVVLDLNVTGLKRAKAPWPVAGDALQLPFADRSFDVVTASLFFHHLTDEQCVDALKEMWRVARRSVLVNDLHRHAAAYYSIRILTVLFSRSAMVRHDGPVSVCRAFRPEELLNIARSAGIHARVFRSFPYRLVLVAEK